MGNEIKVTVDGKILEISSLSFYEEPEDPRHWEEGYYNRIFLDFDKDQPDHLDDKLLHEISIQMPTGEIYSGTCFFRHAPNGAICALISSGWDITNAA
jgi:hypothetical protein